MPVTGNGAITVKADGHSDSAVRTMIFAAEELSEYVYRITGSRPQIPAESAPTSFLITCDGTGEGLGDSEVDRFDIYSKANVVILNGNRPRSCLYAVYAYLEAQGVRFLRPGPHGEIVPRLHRLGRVRLSERASHVHRCICIEGAISIEHALATVDWMAKRRFNEFQLQFETSIFFWNRWYTHELNPRFGMNKDTGRLRDFEPISLEKAVELDNLVIAELKKRDIDLHRMGHGWTSRALGVAAEGWSEAKSSIAEEYRDRVALLNGVRDWHQNPANTELCYSNSKAFQSVVDAVVTYAQEHPEADVLLFCQADGMNQHCECDRCAELSVSDWYARLVNAISDALAEYGLHTRVSFDAYANTIQAPDIEYVRDEHGKLIFVFAPFFRCYEHRLSDPACTDDFPVTKVPRNHAPVIIGNRAYVQMLRQWQARCQSDSFLADYHFIRFHYMFLDEMFVARRVSEDIEDLVPLGFQGYFSCQVLRSFYPTALGMNALADKLWDRRADIDQMVDKHLKSAYGQSAHKVRKYLEGVTAILKPTPGEHDHLVLRADDPTRAAAILDYLCRSEGLLLRLRERAEDPVRALSLDYLVHYNSLMTHICSAVEEFSVGNSENASAKLEEATLFACDTEEETHWALDTWMINFWNTERMSRWSGGAKWFEQEEKH